MKIGILGGTFNPIHYGHIEMARACMSQFGLDKCLFMVAAIPPHKNVADFVKPKERFYMVKSALAECGFENFYADDTELRRNGKSYTADTLQTLRQRYDGAELFLIIGADMLHCFHLWRQPQVICSLADIIAVRRQGYEYSESFNDDVDFLKHTFGARVHVCDAQVPFLSSTDIRNRVYNAMPIYGMLPYAAEMQIYKNALYSPPEIRNITNDLVHRLERKRFLHSVSTMREAILLADRYGADPIRCRIGALVHDCEKLSGVDYFVIARKYNLILDDYEMNAPALIHAKACAFTVEHRYGIHDPVIIDAVLQHTLAAPAMTDVAKVVYLADKIEHLRDYPDVYELRRAAAISLNEGVLACIDSSETRQRIMDKPVHPQTLCARDYLLGEMGCLN